MSTTTIRLTDELKSRVAVIAGRGGVTSHNFILDAMAEKVEQIEIRNDFYDTAESRFEKTVATGKTIPWSEMRSYLESRIEGKHVKRPLARKLAK